MSLSSEMKLNMHRSYNPPIQNDVPSKIEPKLQVGHSRMQIKKKTHITPPGVTKALAEVLVFLTFFALQAMITSSMPSPPMTDQPSSLKPLIASLKPLINL
ncbi:hypothetical protein EE612_051918 [Oryza sativa]|nr:hypothetical protein EE612_051918 [Oryza sativa]